MLHNNAKSTHNDDLENNMKTTTKISPDLFAFYLQRYVFLHSDIMELEHYVKSIDIDKDSFISNTDLEIFLKRSKYFRIIDKRQKSLDSIQPRLLKTTFGKTNIQQNLNPNNALTEDKADDIVRNLRQALFLKKISFYEFFKMLDLNDDGFLTIDEFCSAMNKVNLFYNFLL